MRQCEMQISTQTDNQNQRKKNVATNENWILRKIGSKFQNPLLQSLMQNSTLEQAIVAEWDDYMERDASLFK